MKTEDLSIADLKAASDYALNQSGLCQSMSFGKEAEYWDEKYQKITTILDARIRSIILL